MDNIFSLLVSKLGWWNIFAVWTSSTLEWCKIFAFSSFLTLDWWKIFSVRHSWHANNGKYLKYGIFDTRIMTFLSVLTLKKMHFGTLSIIYNFVLKWCKIMENFSLDIFGTRMMESICNFVRFRTKKYRLGHLNDRKIYSLSLF